MCRRNALARGGRRWKQLHSCAGLFAVTRGSEFEKVGRTCSRIAWTHGRLILAWSATAR